MQTRLRAKPSLPVWRKEQRTDHIYRVAAEIMCEKGFEATSMNDIADAVGLTKAGVYHYIRGKEDLLFEIMSFGMDMVDEDVIAPARAETDAELRLRTIVERHAKRIMEQGGAVTVLLEEMSSLTAAHQRVIRNRKREYFELVRATMEELRKEGKLREVDATVAAFGLIGIVLWTSRWYRRGGSLSPQQAAGDLVEIAMSGVLRKSARPKKGPLGARNSVRKREGVSGASGIKILRGK